jgi:cell wall-associated NlpC family hydrolase
VFSVVVAPSSRPAAADALSSAQAQAAQITAQLQADQQRLDATSQQYEVAQQQVQQVDEQIAQIRAGIAQDHAQVAADQQSLRNEAVNAYMAGTTDNGLQELFGSGGSQATVTLEYQAVAAGNISGAIDALNVAQVHLADQENQLQAAQTQAQDALSQASSARQVAQNTVADQQATLGRVKGQIASLVVQQQAAQEAAAHAAFLARVNAAPSAGSAGGGTSHASNGPAPPSNVAANLPAAGGAARAVAAAESQIGVPYQWGGESPGAGFDCSGLTQWAWGVAGVGLPRTAAAQYGSVAHIPLSALEPGDLVFWGFGGVDHVGMYVGGGAVVHAPSTGETVRIQGIWGDGLIGAGRP